MSVSSATSTAIRTRFYAWTIAMVAMLAAFALNVWPNLKFETDILALLPSAQQDKAMDAALDAFSARIARTQLFLIGAASSTDAKAAAQAFAAQLRASPDLARVNLEVNADLRERFKIVLDHRAYLLSQRDIEALQAGKTDALQQQALRAAFTPSGLLRPIGLADDPLGFVNRFIQAQSVSFGNAQIDGSVATVEHEGHT